ncbi:AAA family ATPase [Chromobacterium vaccinii]|uniref:AAA family ATPase n=1 Tax=Chromobacterium vaccinii TaxID=1108595 RepID=UPI0009E516FD|nr:ATP-binding protein [Chromobacterium vaccinii]
MLKELRLENWKSFKSSSFYIDKITTLIGTNSSGKSNCLDALSFLNRIATGMSLTSALKGEGVVTGIRGGLEWAPLQPSNKFSITVVCENPEDDRTDYIYNVEAIIIDNRCELSKESLKRIKYRPTTRNNPYEINLYWTEPCQEDDPFINAKLYNEKRGSLKKVGKSNSILSQLAQQSIRQEINEGVEIVRSCLKNIFILDPIPSHMRGFSALSEHLENDASNIAGVIAALSEKDQIESKLSRYLKKLPEKDISRIYAETVGKFNSDAMLYCEEAWEDRTHPHTIDARGMSDGTLRFLAIATALLTRPKGSLLIVEEIDNGLHPSRAGLLVGMLQEIGKDNGVDVLFTTHNPALLDAIGPSGIPFIMVAHRDNSSYSKITPLEEIEPLAKMIASGSIGKLSATGKIEEILRG